MGGWTDRALVERMSTTIIGEALLRDASGILVYQVMYPSAKTRRVIETLCGSVISPMKLLMPPAEYSTVLSVIFLLYERHHHYCFQGTTQVRVVGFAGGAQDLVGFCCDGLLRSPCCKRKSQ